MRSSGQLREGRRVTVAGLRQGVTSGPPQRTRSPMLVLALLACVGCTSNVNSSPGGDELAWFETEGRDYVWNPITRGRDSGLEVEIPVVFTNHGEATVFIHPCLGPNFVSLELWDGARWIMVWQPVQPLAGSPCRVAPKASYVDTVRVLGFFPPSGTHPIFQHGDLEGEFRLTWPAIYSDDAYASEERTPSGPPIPLEQRVSNTFRIALP